MNELIFIDIINWLVSFMQKKEIRYHIIREAPSFCSKAIPKERLILININWSNPFELPFIIGHEASHVVEQSTCNVFNRSALERKANLGAIILLLNYLNDSQYLTQFSELLTICYIPPGAIAEARFFLENNILPGN